MPFTEIDMRFFSPVAMLKPENSSHVITKGKLDFSHKTWFCKEVSDPIRARYEILSQEFYRLLNPEQPQTHLAKDHTTNQYYILSEEIVGFRPIPANKKVRLTHGVYSGLGQILVLAVFLHEIDLNLGNLGVNEENTIIKIDGDWSFASLIRPDLFADKPSAITAELIQSLPRLTGYFAYNWLDICHKGTDEIESNLFAEELKTTPHFRFEIHQAIFFIMMLSPSYLKKLVDFYVPENAATILEFLLSRQVQLKMSGMQDPLFLEFLSSVQANVIGRTYMRQMCDLTMSDNSFLEQSEKEDLKQHCHVLCESLKVNLMNFRPRILSYASSPNTDIEEDSISSSSSFASVANSHRLFTPSPGGLKSPSSSVLKFNRTCSNLSQLSDGNGI